MRYGRATPGILRRWWLYKRILFIGGPVVVLLSLSIFSGIACDAGAVTVTETVTNTESVTDTAARETQQAVGYASSSIYSGLFSLEETILYADVIAVVDLLTVDRGVDEWKYDTDVVYSKTLEFTFEVKEYLKGSGDDQIVGIVFEWSQLYDTASGANLGKEPDPDRKEHWDNRTAVVFLRDDGKDPDLNWKADRYYLGLADDREGESYSIANRHYRAWLPAASDRGDEQRFLLGPDLGESPQHTITLDDLKALISSLDQEIAGQTDEYIDCVRYKYSWEREVRHRKESLGGVYHYIREDVNVSSGMPKGAKVFTNRHASYVASNPAPGGGGDYVLAGRDEQYFLGAMPGEIFLDRPLPQGEYKVNHSFLPYHMQPCGATVPEDEMGRWELVLTVTAPVGTLHEAFFDPVLDDKAIVGLLEPATFTDANGASGVLLFILWEAEAGGVGTVKLELSPQSSLAGHTVEFITLDGSVSLSLKVDDAEEDEKTGALSWKVESQPWKAGDKLMLRISASTK